MKIILSKLTLLVPILLLIFVYFNVYIFVYHASQTPMMIIQDSDENRLFEHENNNIPDHYLTKNSRPIKLNQTSCVEYPAYFDLKFNNHHWQVLERKESIQIFDSEHLYAKYNKQVERSIFIGSCLLPLNAFF